LKHAENWNKYIEKNCASSWSFTKYHSVVCKIPEEHRSHLHHCRSLKSHILSKLFATRQLTVILCRVLAPSALHLFTLLVKHVGGYRLVWFGLVYLFIHSVKNVTLDMLIADYNLYITTQLIWTSTQYNVITI